MNRNRGHVAFNLYELPFGVRAQEWSRSFREASFFLYAAGN